MFFENYITKTEKQLFARFHRYRYRYRVSRESPCGEFAWPFGRRRGVCVGFLRFFYDFRRAFIIYNNYYYNFFFIIFIITYWVYKFDDKLIT